MKIQLCYRCRFCRQDELRDVPENRAGASEHYMLHEAAQAVTHECSESGSHVGLCDLVGAVVVEGLEVK
jgi:hypothetical protein